MAKAKEIKPEDIVEEESTEEEAVAFAEDVEVEVAEEEDSLVARILESDSLEEAKDIVIESASENIGKIRDAKIEDVKKSLVRGGTQLSKAWRTLVGGD